MRKPVLTIFYQFNPWRSSIGGIQTVIKSFIKYAPSKFDVRVVGTGDELSSPIGKWQTAELADREIQFLPLFALNDDNVRSFIPTTLKYTTALFGHNFASDFMHFHRLEPTLATQQWVGEKTLFIHNDIHRQVSQGKAQKGILWQHFPAGYFALERLLVNQFTQIFSCNTEAEKFYQQRYPAIASRVSYLKNTVDTEIFSPLTKEQQQAGRQELAQQLGVAANSQFILFAGRLHPQKDPLLLIQALAALPEPTAHLLIAGEGELAAELRTGIDKLKLSERVTMLGAVAQAEVARLQRLCSLFILTSAYEGLPLVVLEALACGTPIVTTRCGETPNLLLPGSGIVCQERTPEAVATAIRQILRYPEDYPAEACVRAAKPYSAQSVVGEVYSNMWQRWEQRVANERD